MKVAKEFTFESAHYINGHTRCGQVHGHTWKLTVTLSAYRLNSNGMLIDFHDLSDVVRHVIQRIDHRLINDELSQVDYFNDKPITAETLVVWLTKEIAICLPHKLEISTLTCRLQEGPGGWAEYTLGELVEYTPLVEGGAQCPHAN